MLQTKNNLWSEYLKRRYLRGEPLSHAHLPSKSSSQWKHLYKVRDVFHASCRWIIGEGNLLFWYDNWSGHGSLCSLLHENEWTSVESKEILLNEVLTPEGQWNTSALGEVPTYLM